MAEPLAGGVDRTRQRCCTGESGVPVARGQRSGWQFGRLAQAAVVAGVVSLGHVGAADAGPYDRHSVRLEVLGGYHYPDEQGYVTLGAGASWFAMDGLELGADVDVLVPRDPLGLRLAPRINFVVLQIPVCQPYVGVYWSHQFAMVDEEAINGVGWRIGVQWVMWQRWSVRLAVRRQYRFPECAVPGCSEWTPEVGVGAWF